MNVYDFTYPKLRCRENISQRETQTFLSPVTLSIQLLLEALKAFPGQIGHIIPTVCLEVASQLDMPREYPKGGNLKASKSDT